MKPLNYYIEREEKILSKMERLVHNLKEVRNKIREFEVPTKFDERCEVCGSSMYIKDRKTGEWKCYDCQVRKEMDT